MPHLCPRPCSRLSTAAVFISVGVVQFIAGIILLRSEYVYLLAGPDFWTSICNIAVGCLLGVAASIWKSSTKHRPTKKQILRRNLLLVLLFSALAMNTTTLGIYLLAETDALLSIHLQKGKKYNETTLVSEILTYAYVTSVCCPIICIVLTIVSISGSCFKYAAVKKNPLETKTVVNTKHGRTEPIRWIYTPELLNKPKKKMRKYLSSSSESLSDDDAKNDSSYHKYSSSAEEVHDVLSRMAQGKRDSMLSDSAVMLREMDLRRKNKYDSFDRDGSYVRPMLQRARESILGERQPKEQSVRCAESSHTRVKEPPRDYLTFSEITSLSPEDVGMKRTKYAKSKQFSTLYRNPYTSEDLVNEYQDASSKLAKHYPSQYKKFRQRFRSASDLSNRGEALTGIHKKPRMTEDLELGELPSEYREQRKWKSSDKMQEKEENKSFDEMSPSYCLSPDGSDFGGDSIFDMSRRSSWAGEIVPISIKNSSGLKLSHKLIPVPNPVVPLPKIHDAPKISDDSGIGSVESNTFNEIQNSDCKHKKGLSSFQEDSAVRNKDHVQEYQKVGLQNIKKYDMKVVKMASISEEPNIEINNRFDKSPERYDSQDDGDLNSWKCYSGKKSPLRFESNKEKNRDKVNLRRDTTTKRKANGSNKALRRIWSVDMSESKNDFRKQVVDEDSLIGLSEEELIARQFRTRSIRKVVQQRMREKVGM